MTYAYLFTRCGLPYGGCALCNPEHHRRYDPAFHILRERAEAIFSVSAGRRMMTDEEWRQYCARGMGDYDQICPAWWDPKYVRRILPHLIRIYKGDIGKILRSTLKIRKEHDRGTWGYKFYTVMIEALTDE